MLNPGGDIEDLYRDFAKNYPLKTDDSGWDEFLQKLENAPVTKLPPEKPAGGNPFADILKKYGYWLSAAALVAVLTTVFVVSNKKESNGPPAATTAAQVDNSSPLPANNNGTTHLAPTTAGAAKQPAAADQPQAVVPETATAKGAGQATVANAEGGLNKTHQSAKTVGGLSALPATNGKQPRETNPQDNITQYTTEPTGGAPKSTAKNTTVGTPVKPAATTPKDSPANTLLNGQISAGGNNTGSKTTQSGIAKKSITKPFTDTKPTSVIDTATIDNKQIGSNNTGSIFQASVRRPVTVADSALQAPKKLDSAANQPSEVTASQPNMGDATPRQTETVDSSNSAAMGILPDAKATIIPLKIPASATGKGVDSAAAIQPVVSVKTRDEPYFYAGVTAGPDFSTVKFQTIQKTGSNVGLQLGVYLGHHLSIESGLLFSTKNYYTSGSYFKRPFNVPNDRQDLTSLTANAKILEIPITLRYDVVHKKRFKLFVNGGLSSYFTENERYNFLFHRPMGYEDREEESDDVYTNIFSVLHLSAGLEFKLTLRNALRFEPYIKLPFSGFGAGSLPVTSTGIYLNFTHSFLK